MGCIGSEIRLMTARAMNDWDVLDDDELLATAKAFRRLLDGGCLSAADVALHHFSSR
jgi:hypothetical protein